MTARPRILNLGGAVAFVLHRPHPATTALTRQLAAIGLTVHETWPALPAEALGADFVFFDADLGHDEQFAWGAGEAPMPTVALIGSEAPGRIEWALAQGADSHLVKPVGNAGIYSALLIARRNFEARRDLLSENAALRARIGERQTIVKAVIALTVTAGGEDRAYAQLRTFATTWQVTIEVAAAKILELKEGAHDDRTARL